MSPNQRQRKTRFAGVDGLPGTIFGVYLADPSKSARENALQPGNKLVAGGYCLYSSSTVRDEPLPHPPAIPLHAQHMNSVRCV